MKRFTVHTDVLTRKSKFLAAARKSEWLAGDSSKPVDLSDEDPDVFQDYLNCVYIGSDTLGVSREAFEREVLDSVAGSSDIVVENLHKSLTNAHLIALFEKFGEIKKHIIADDGMYCTASIQFATAEAGKAAIKACDNMVLNGRKLRVTADHKCPDACAQYDLRKIELADHHYKALISLYLLADKLQDIVTANKVMDKIDSFHTITEVHPGKEPISIAYQSTVEGSPLRKLLRDLWFYNTNVACRKRLQEGDFPKHFLLDMVSIYVGVKTIDESYSFAHFTDNVSSDFLSGESERKIPGVCRYHQHDDEHPFCLERTYVWA